MSCTVQGGYKKTWKMSVKTDMLAYCYFAVSRNAKYCNQHVCIMSVCMSVHKHISETSLVLFWCHCNTLYTLYSSSADDFMFTRKVMQKKAYGQSDWPCDRFDCTNLVVEVWYLLLPCLLAAVSFDNLSVELLHTISRLVCVLAFNPRLVTCTVLFYICIFLTY